jgi:hypothetical protein
MSSQQPPENGSQGENRPENNWSERRYDRREWRHHNHPLRGLFWGLLLIVLGILFFGEKQGWFPSGNWWQYLLIAIGGCFIIDGLINLAVPQPVHDIAGKFIPGVILVCIGLAFIYGFEMWWPLVLVAAGVVILLSLLFRRRE